MFNLRDAATQAALRVLPEHAQREALAYLDRQWKANGFPGDLPCPYVKAMRPSAMTVAIRGGKLVAWTMSVYVVHNGNVRVTRCEGRYTFSENSVGETAAQLLMKKAGITKTLKWYNQKWINVEY